MDNLLFERFERLANLGKGGMGDVYRVRDTVDGRECALKVIRPELLEDGGVSKRFRREFRAMARLDHPNVVRVYDFFEDEEGTAGYSMDLVEGKNLNEIRDQETQVDSQRSFAQVRHLLPFFVQVLRGLAHVHRQGLIHRDIKPSNVLIAGNDQAYLADFGLVQRQDKSDSSKDLTRSGSVLGTFRYMSPEQANGLDADHRTDLYSVGVMLYEFLLGQHPFGGKGGMAMGVAHINDTPARPQSLLSDLPDVLDQVIMQCLEKEPFRRPSFAEEVLSQIQGVLDPNSFSSPTSGSTDSSHGDPFQPASGSSAGQEEAEKAFLMQPNFVGRKQELAWASRLLNGLNEGKSFSLALEGESGIGKSRLLKEIRGLTRLKGMACFHAVSGEKGQTTLQSIARGVEMTFAMDRSLISDSQWGILAEWLPAATLDPKLPRPEGSAEFLRGRGMEALVNLEVSALEKFPVVVLLDDVQWMDPESVLVWTFMMDALKRKTGHGAIGVIMAYRQEDRDENHMAPLLKRVRAGQEPTMNLRAFSEEVTTDFVQQMLGQKTRPVKFGRRVHQETEGHPFFIEEVMKSLVEEGLIYFDPQEEDPWRAQPELMQAQGYRGLKVPASVQEVLKRRLMVLPAAAYKLLSVAACIDKEFHFDLLLAASDEDEDSALDCLELFLKRQLVSEADEQGTRFAFHHENIREVMLSQLPKRKQRLIHQKILDALEAHPNWCSAGDPREELGLHAYHAEALEKALTYYSEAGLARFAEGSIRRADIILEQAWQVCQILIEEGSPVATEIQMSLLRSLVTTSIILGKAFERDDWSQKYLDLETQWREDLPKIPLARSAWRFKGFEKDPAQSSTNGSAAFCAPLYEGLVKLHPMGKVVPGIASSWDYNEGRRTYTFQLRPEARFHNGKPVTATDVKASWERALSCNNPVVDKIAWVFEPIDGAEAFQQGQADEISGVKVLGTHSLEVHLHYPVSFFLDLLSYKCLAVIPAGTAIPLAGPPPIGSGPFQLIEEGDDKIVMQAFPDYYDPMQQKVERLEYRVNMDMADFVPALISGELDYVNDLSRSELDQIENFQDLQVRQQLLFNITYLGMRCDIPPFDNPLVRRALCYAMDRELLAEQASGSLATPARGLLPPGMMGYDPEHAFFGFDPDRAKMLLQQAGYSDGLDLKIYRESPDHFSKDLVLCLNMARDVGFRVETVPMERADYLEREKQMGKPALFLNGWYADYPDPDAFFFSLFQSNHQKVMGTCYQNLSLDTLIEEGRLEHDLEKRIKTYQAAEKMLLRDAPACFLYHETGSLAWHANRLDLPVIGVVEPLIRPQYIFPPKLPGKHK